MVKLPHPPLRSRYLLIQCHRLWLFGENGYWIRVTTFYEKQQA